VGAAAGPRHTYWRDADGSLTGTTGATVLGAYLAQRDGSRQDQGSAVAGQACSYVQVCGKAGCWISASVRPYVPRLRRALCSATPGLVRTSC
jgi:hypothetical protein